MLIGPPLLTEEGGAQSKILHALKTKNKPHPAMTKKHVPSKVSVTIRSINLVLLGPYWPRTDDQGSLGNYSDEASSAQQGESEHHRGVRYVDRAWRRCQAHP